MTKTSWIRVVLLAGFVAVAWNIPQASDNQTAFAQQQPAAPAQPAGDEPPPPPQFRGVEQCKMCHRKVEKGEQYRIWSESKHAQAFVTLATDKARELATQRGIQGNPQEAPECLRCHVTAYGEPAERLYKKFDPTQGVQCEACHGAGGDYWTEKVMQDREAAIAKGLVIPTEETCRGCHNADSPGFNAEEWNYEEKFALIAHPLPEHKKAQEGEAAPATEPGQQQQH